MHRGTLSVRKSQERVAGATLLLVPLVPRLVCCSAGDSDASAERKAQPARSESAKRHPEMDDDVPSTSSSGGSSIPDALPYLGSDSDWREFRWAWGQTAGLAGAHCMQLEPRAWHARDAVPVLQWTYCGLPHARRAS